ncbi:MAG TPA: hypothetical protein VH681_03620 [Nitrospiraceae bacterium]|jgi:hypothetical protein
MKARKWMMEYGVAIILTFLFAMVLGQIPLFRETMIGKLHASDVVQFLGYGGAMIIGWFGARQLSTDPPDDWKWLMPYRALILPVVTLLMVGVLYGVLLYVCEPFMTKSAKTIYNWVFIAGIIGASVWLIMTWVQKCAPLVASMETRRLRKAA